MRTLKKSLCLILSLVMVLGLCAINVSAANDFTDIEDSKYEDAIKVLNAIGVIDGMTDTTYEPNGTFTRAQGAAIVARLLGQFTKEAKTTYSDTASVESWAGFAINYLTAQGIADGTSDTTFDPNGTLTGSAFAKWVLGALGYDPELEGMTGADWEIGVAKLVRSIGLDDGIDAFDQSAPLTRELAAQIGFTALEEELVTYNTTVTTSSSGKATTSDVKATGTGDKLMKEYFPKLAKVQGVNSLGETTQKWVNGVESIITYTTKKNATAVGSDLAAYTYTGNAFYINGIPITVTISAANIADYTGTGVLVKLYANDNKQVNKVVVLNTYLAKVTAKDSVGKSVTLTIQGHDALANVPITVSSTVNKSFYKELSTYSKGDYVLLTAFDDSDDTATPDNAAGANNTIRVLSGKPEVVSGKLTKIDASTSPTTYTFNGKDYYLTQSMRDATPIVDPNLDTTGFTVSATTTYNAYLDTYGNNIGFDTVTTAANYAFVIATDSDGSVRTGDRTYYAQLAFADGSTEWVTVTSVGGSKNAVASAIGSSITSNKFVTYTKGDDGYDLTLANTTSSVDTQVIAKNTISFDSVSLTSSSILLVAQSDGTYVAYKGVANMPNMTISGYKLVNDNDEVVMVVTSSTGATSGNVYYVPAAHANRADADNTEVIGSTTVYTYEDAIYVNGVLTTVKTSVTGNIAAGVYDAVTMNANGYITSFGSAKSADSSGVPDSPASAQLASSLDNTVYRYTLDKRAILTANTTSLTIKDADATRTALLSDEFKALSVTSAGAVSDITEDLTDGTARLGLAARDDVYIAMNAGGTVDYIIVINTTAKYAVATPRITGITNNTTAPAGTYATSDFTVTADVTSDAGDAVVVLTLTYIGSDSNKSADKVSTTTTSTGAASDVELNKVVIANAAAGTYTATLAAAAPITALDVALEVGGTGWA